MKKFKVATLAFVVAMSSILVSACSIGSNPTNNQTSDAATQAPSQTVVETKPSDAETTVPEESTTIVSETTVSITLRIEGSEANLFYGALSNASTSLVKVLEDIDSEDASLNITIEESQYGPYLSAINDDAASKFGSYDGWLFLINGEEPPVGMGEIELADGDNVVIFYGDPYGVGMQFPKTSVEGKTLTFTSTDVTFDAIGNISVDENPVVGMTVVVDDSDTFVTDENGSITLPDAFEAGAHTLSVSRYNENGCPTVLRYAPMTMVTIE